VSDILILKSLTIFVLYRAKKLVGFTSHRYIVKKICIERDRFVSRLYCIDEWVESCGSAEVATIVIPPICE